MLGWTKLAGETRFPKGGITWVGFIGEISIDTQTNKNPVRVL